MKPEARGDADGGIVSTSNIREPKNSGTNSLRKCSLLARALPTSPQPPFLLTSVDQVQIIIGMKETELCLE